MATLAARPGWPAHWEVVPSLTVEETYSDNINLGPPGSERSDWVTSISPRIVVRATGDRLKFDADYRPELLWWANEGSSRVLHFYNVGGTAQFVRDLLFVDARAIQTEQVLTLTGPQSDSTINLTGNRTSVRTTSISPYLRRHFGPYADAEARYTFSTLGTNERTQNFENRASTVDVTVASGLAFRRLTWNFAYKHENIDYDEALVRDVSSERVSAGGKFFVLPSFALTANAGYEHNDYLTTGPEPRGPFWNAGFEWNPSPRTHVAASAGRRFFGPTLSFEFSHRTRLSVWSASYVEDVSTTRAELLLPSTLDTRGYLDTLFTSTIPDAATRAAAITAFLARNQLPASFAEAVNFFTAVPFVLKRLQASVGLEGSRNTLLATVFRETREALSSSTDVSQPGIGDFALSDRTTQTGGSLLLSTRLNSRTSANLAAGVARNDFTEISRRDTRRYVRLGLTRQLLPRVTGTLTVRRLQNSSTDFASRYKENAIGAAVTALF